MLGCLSYYFSDQSLDLFKINSKSYSVFSQPAGKTTVTVCCDLSHFLEPYIDILWEKKYYILNVDGYLQKSIHDIPT